MRTTKTDVEIQRDVLMELGWDVRVPCCEIGVSVHHHIVTLTGTVTSDLEKLAAEQAAHRVLGVQDVANDILVRSPTGAGRTDSDLAAAVRQALLWDAFVVADDIETTVSDGVVTLRGEVDDVARKEAAERAIRDIVGVRAVQNAITVVETAPSTGRSPSSRTRSPRRRSHAPRACRRRPRGTGSESRPR